jgi:hypothetical protein
VVESFCTKGYDGYFSNFLKINRERVENYYEERFLTFVNEEKMKEFENVLDPGFEKLCGLKGNKLSGGQK